MNSYVHRNHRRSRHHKTDQKRTPFRRSASAGRNHSERPEDRGQCGCQRRMPDSHPGTQPRLLRRRDARNAEPFQPGRPADRQPGKPGTGHGGRRALRRAHRSRTCGRIGPDLTGRKR